MTFPIAIKVAVRLLVLAFFLLLMIRTRSLWFQMLELNDMTTRQEELELSLLLQLHHPTGPRKTHISTDEYGHDPRDSKELLQSDPSDAFLSQVKQLDGMSESLSVLLGTAVARHKDSGIDITTIDQDVEDARCRRYGFELLRPLRRRRIFWGSLIADDSWHVLGIAAIEYHGLFDTIAFVESNVTQSYVPRTMRFPQGSARRELVTSPILWGNTTRVHVDYYTNDDIGGNGLGRENDQRSRIFQRWKKNGMSYDDIGYLSDMDEVATRDFLLALQVCDVPEFQTTGKDSNGTLYRDCISPKISSSTVCYEGTPLCMQVPRRLGRPDWAIGECIDGIGDPSQHPPVRRTRLSAPKERVRDWKKYVGEITDPTTNITTKVNGPLWDATDFRLITDRRMVGTTSHGYARMLPTGYQFHNFYDSLDTLRFKYETYGHAKKGALHMPLGQIQPNDVGFMVDCLTGRTTSGSKWKQPGVSDWFLMDPIWGTPIAFQKVPHYVELRHKEFQQELARDELLYPPNITNKVL